MPRSSPSSRFERRTPDGDNLPRLVCPDCGFIHYENPKVIVGSVCSHDGRILLCRRAIEPRRGFWTIPAGYLELNETAEAGAMREAVEEACARIAIDGLLAVYTIPRISQVQLIYRARLENGEFAAGEETLELDLFEWGDIPWADLAFPSVRWALEHWRETAGARLAAPFTNPDGDDGNMRA